MKTTKDFLLLFFVCCTALNLSAQSPTITSAEFEVPGDSLIFQPCVHTNFNPGPSGANVTWDFSNLTPSGSPGRQYWVAPSSNLNGDSFPMANQSVISPIGSSGTYIVDGYYQLTNTAFSVRGYEDAEIEYYSDAEDFVRFPCSYNSSFVDSFHALIHPQGGGPIYPRLGAIQVSADGYGTLKLPDGTYTNVLRVKFVEKYKDDLGAFGAVQYTSVLYNWYKPGTKGVLLAYDSAWHTNSTARVILSYVRNTTHAGIDDQLTDASVQLYPNPADKVITLTVPDVVFDYSIADLNGKVMQAATTNYNSAKLNVADFASGLYFINLKTADGTIIVKKVIIN
jgi:hypothetical protein